MVCSASGIRLFSYDLLVPQTVQRCEYIVRYRSFAQLPFYLLNDGRHGIRSIAEREQVSSSLVERKNIDGE